MNCILMSRLILGTNDLRKHLGIQMPEEVVSAKEVNEFSTQVQMLYS